MKKIKIALIDSGVDINHSDLYDKYIQGIELTGKRDKSYVKNSFSDVNGHGTAIAGIIFDKCKNIDLLSIKVFDKDLKCSFDSLYKSLKFAIEENVQIINLSLGTTEKKHEEKLYRLCEVAVNKGIYIVSAFHNKETVSYPAAFTNVFGVIGKKFNYKYGYIYDSNTNKVIANGARQRDCWSDNSYEYIYGNSFACANFTGILANLMYESSINCWNDLKKEIIKNSLNNKQCEEIDEKDERKWMKRILYFPINKENIEIIKKMDDNEEHKSIGIYDSRPVYQDYYEVEKESKTIKLKIYNNIEVGLENADTLMIGDLNFIPRNKQVQIKRDLIKKAIIFGKNILSKDALLVDDYCDLYELADKKGIIMKSVYV